VEPSLHFRCKALQPPYNQTQFCFDCCLLFEVLELVFQVVHPFTHPRHPRLKFLLVNQPLSIAINQTGNPSLELAYLRF
jgi:hypothetical protein